MEVFGQTAVMGKFRKEKNNEMRTRTPTILFDTS